MAGTAGTSRPGAGALETGWSGGRNSSTWPQLRHVASRAKAPWGSTLNSLTMAHGVSATDDLRPPSLHHGVTRPKPASRWTRARSQCHVGNFRKRR